VQLKEKIHTIQQFFLSDEGLLKGILGEGYVKYQDIISEQDTEFWRYLCNKDFKRLQKLLNQGLGEGIFFDDTDSDDSDDNNRMHGSDSDEEDDIRMHGRNKLQNRRERVGEGNRGDYDDEDDFDHDGFMEQMLAEMHTAQEEEMIKKEQLKKQMMEDQERQEAEKYLKEAEYGQNQFWKLEENF
jgi:hypothetical protein